MAARRHPPMISILVLSLAVTAAAGIPAPQDLAAVGIVVSPRSERSVAVLRSQGRTRMGSVGDTVFGGRIVAISRDTVVVLWSDGPHEVRLAGVGLATRAALAPTPDAPKDAQAGDRTFERKEVERRLGDEMQRILAETSLLPVTSAGRVTGLTINRMPEGTVLSDAGLQSGDILTEINGTPIDSMATLIGLWGRLQGENVIHAQVLRNGQPVSLGLVLR